MRGEVSAGDWPIGPADSLCASTIESVGPYLSLPPEKLAQLSTIPSAVTWVASGRAAAV